MIVYTRPREVEPRFARDGDQVAIFATHYDPSTPYLAVRTTNLAEMGEPLIEWVTLIDNPKLRHGTAGAHELTFAASGDKIVTMPFREREQIVIREAVTIEPWDGGDCNRATDDGGVCYLPARHAGGCDSDPGTVEAMPERSGDDLAALVDVVGDAA